jgi:4-hydroxybutyrate dehydrogenase
MEQYNFPTTILYGGGALDALSERLREKGHKKALIVTDSVIRDLGMARKLTDLLSAQGIPYAMFSDVHPNPTDADVDEGVQSYRENGCDSIIALGGGSPMDVAKVVKVMVAHPPPLEQYDDALGGDRLITEPMPPLYAIPTTAGTGSEVGRSGVIIMRNTGRKTIFFHPHLMPNIAVLEPEMTVSLPPDITAATGIDAFSHCMEAYFAPMFHPMADGIALQGMELILIWLPRACSDGTNIEAREKMLIAATMGATAFQKGLGMIHSLAHPLSSMYGIHHGLANALLIPDCVEFLERSDLSYEQRYRIERVRSLFVELDLDRGSLSASCRDFFKSLGVKFGLSRYKVSSSDLERLSSEAFADPCHASNMIPITEGDLLKICQTAY